MKYRISGTSSLTISRRELFEILGQASTLEIPNNALVQFFDFGNGERPKGEDGKFKDLVIQWDLPDKTQQQALRGPNGAALPPSIQPNPHGPHPDDKLG